MNNKLLKKIGLYAGILLLFIGLAYGFTPEVLDGKIVNQGDISQWKGMANEAMTHNEAHPEDPTAWSNSMFGGMPTTATIDSFEGDYTDGFYDLLLTGRRPASYLLIALIGGFLLMLSLGTSSLIAVGGAIAMTFCSYNFQIITAGHNTKMQAIAYFPWVLAAVIFTYKAALKESRFLDKKWWLKIILGAVLFGFALSFQIKANHIQITYYLAIVIFIFAIGLLIYLCIDKARRSSMLKNFFIASGILLVTGSIGIATNANKLIPTNEFSKYTMRGGSELSSNSETHNKNGLDLEYATRWSYGLEEMPNLLIPNYNGGGSGTLIEGEAKSGFTNAMERAYVDMFIKQYGEPSSPEEELEYSEAAKSIVADEMAKSKELRLPTYWGPQPGTAGPMYMGAVTIFLFVLGMILCKGREKWWLFAAVVVSIFLAWGNHFMWHTKLWFEFAPMYNKFRTVSMALIVLQIALPMLGFVVLDRIMNAHYEKRKLFISGGIAFALTAGFCLLCMLNSNIAGTHTADMGSDILAQWMADHRKDMLVSDARRSFILILIAAILIALPYVTKTFKTESMRKVLAGGVIFVVLFDLWGAGKRYLNESNFITPKDFTSVYEPREVDTAILSDTTNYRVLDVTRDIFNSAITSYHHKSIGGYSPVKLQRYQDLISTYISPEINTVFRETNNPADFHIISMLNTKYIIIDEVEPFENPYAWGNCWYTEEYISAKNPDEELAQLKNVKKYRTVIGDDFKWAQETIDKIHDNSRSKDEIKLIDYAPNQLIYSYDNERMRAAIFSEVYYPKGWKAWIEPNGVYGKVVDGRYQPTADGYQIDLFRANWILRGAIIPEGEGKLIMRFEPESYRIGENISRISSILLILMLLGSAGALIWWYNRHFWLD